MSEERDDGPDLGPDSSRTYPLYTSEEADTLQAFVADGGHYLHFEEDLVNGALHYVNPRLRYTVNVQPPPALMAPGVTPENRLTATKEGVLRLNLDQALVILYIVGLLTRADPETNRPQGKAMLDLDDLIEKAGWVPRTTQERMENRRDMVSFLDTIGRAVVYGRRGIKYFDRAKGQEIDTNVSTVLWSITGYQQPVQPGMFPELAEPVGIQVVMTEEWLNLLSGPDTVQYLPMGEVLGTIPGGRNAGAWAKAIGLSYANFMRRNARQVLQGRAQPTRGELLLRVTPRTGPVKSVLYGRNPGRAVEYWCQALGILAKRGFLAPEGEPEKTVADILEPLPKYNWQDEWLRSQVNLAPGLRMREALERIVANQPVELAPVAKKRGRGRPRKT